MIALFYAGLGNFLLMFDDNDEDYDELHPIAPRICFIITSVSYIYAFASNIITEKESKIQIKNSFISIHAIVLYTYAYFFYFFI